VLLSYVSGNRDEDVFDEPFRFDIGRDPNKHIASATRALLPGCGAARLEVKQLLLGAVATVWSPSS
jgi:cytochrome P450